MNIVSKKVFFLNSPVSNQKQVEPLLCPGCDCDPVAVQQADFVVHEAPVAPQHALQSLGQVHHGLQLRLTPLFLPVDGLIGGDRGKSESILCL